MMNNDRGRGASGPKKKSKHVPRYGISPQMAPTYSTPAQQKALKKGGETKLSKK